MSAKHWSWEYDGTTETFWVGFWNKEHTRFTRMRPTDSEAEAQVTAFKMAWLAGEEV